MSTTAKNTGHPVTVSIVNFNTHTLLQNCITHLEKYLPNIQKIIIINHSTETLSVTSIAPLTILTQPNRGFGAGHNYGFREIYRNIVPPKDAVHLFLNPDIHITRDITPLLRHFHDTSVAAVGAQLTDINDMADPYAAGMQPTLYRTLFDKIRIRRLPTAPQTVHWVSGAALFVRAIDFHAINGFDENYFLYFEDVDLCTRLTQRSKKIIFDPSVTIRHNSGQSFTNYHTQKRYYDAGQERYFMKYHSTPHALAQRILRTIWRKYHTVHHQESLRS